jgi:hypothetical protein
MISKQAIRIAFELRSDSDDSDSAPGMVHLMAKRRGQGFRFRLSARWV